MARKTITRNQQTGARGEAYVEHLFREMGFLYHPTGGLEAGIDGYVQIVDPATGEATNLNIGVQVKATDTDFAADDGKEFDYPCSDDDLHYWLSGNMPVILVRTRPGTKEAYWVSVKDYFESPDKRRTRKVRYVKERDRLDEGAQGALIELARSYGEGTYLRPLPVKETLVSNLIPVKGIGGALYSADIEEYKRGQLWAKVNEKGLKIPGEWVIWKKRLWSVHDLQAPPWHQLVNISTYDDSLTLEDWAYSESHDERRQFVQLMRFCLKERLYRARVRFHNDLGHYYFQATKNKGDRKIRYREGGAPVTVFYGWCPKDTATPVFYRHSAMRSEWRYFDGRWYLEVTPTYHYTWNGWDLDPRYEKRLRKIKEREGNRDVLSQLLVWAHTLQQESPLLGTYPFLRFGEPASFDVDVGIDDEAWKKAKQKGKVVVLGPTLFDGIEQEAEVRKP
jgi:hypothetical protein